MKKIKAQECVICEKKIEQKPTGRERKYCCTKCSSRYHSQKNRSKANLPGGKAQCEHCGKEFTRAENSKCRCCSRMCEHALGRCNEVKTIRQIVAEEKERESLIELRGFALELHSKGYSRTAIREALELPSHILPYWIRYYTKDKHGNWRFKTEYGQRKKNKKAYYSYANAETADEWLSELRERVREPDCHGEPMLVNRQINIVCGVTSINKNADSLSAIIEARLQMDPFNGAAYVFCGKGRDKIRCIFWDGSGYNVVSRRRERGTYPWPSTKLGVVLAITLKDFELITLGDTKKPIHNWDCVDFFKDLAN